MMVGNVVFYIIVDVAGREASGHVEATVLLPAQLARVTRRREVLRDEARALLRDRFHQEVYVWP